MWELLGKNWAPTPSTDGPTSFLASSGGAGRVSGSRRLDTRRGLNEREEEEE